MRAGRVDANQSDVDDALAAMGWGVVPIPSIRCDRLIAKAGRLLLLEVKDGDKPPSKQKLTQAEVKFHALMQRFGVHVITVTCLEDLQQLDREARIRHEPGYQGRDFYRREAE